jgi:predicted HicB family RNase H-like nuclease
MGTKREDRAMSQRRKTEIVQVNLRLREELRQRLAKEAERSGRSFNQELVYRLTGSLSQEEITQAVRKAVQEMITPLGQVRVGSGRPGKPIPKDEK